MVAEGEGGNERRGKRQPPERAEERGRAEPRNQEGGGAVYSPAPVEDIANGARTRGADRRSSLLTAGKNGYMVEPMEDVGSADIRSG